MTSSVSAMESEILRRLAEEEAHENASLNSYNSSASRYRAAAAAAQPSALAMLNSVRGLGGSGLGGSGLGGSGLGGSGLGGSGLGGSGLGGSGLGGSGLGGSSSLFQGGAAPAGPSLYDVALLQQRLAVEEQSRMRVMAQAAAAMRQQQQLSQMHQQHQLHQHEQQQHEQYQRNMKRSAPPRLNKAQERLRKKRKVMELPPLMSLEPRNPRRHDFRLPTVGGTDYTPLIKPWDGFRSNWDKCVAKAKSEGGNAEEQHAFVRYHFGKTLAQNRGHKADGDKSGRENRLGSGKTQYDNVSV